MAGVDDDQVPFWSELAAAEEAYWQRRATLYETHELAADPDSDQEVD